MDTPLPIQTATTSVEHHDNQVPSTQPERDNQNATTTNWEEADKRRKKYLAQLEAQHQAEVRRIEYEKQLRQQQIREELEQRRKRYEQNGFRF